MANYKPVAHAAQTLIQTKLYEDKAFIAPASSSSANALEVNLFIGAQ